METSKPVKPAKKSASSAIRVSTETRKRLVQELAKINKKQHGKRVRLDALLLKLLPKITAQDVADLQEASLSGRDRLEQNYRAYYAKFGHVTMDEFLAIVSAQAVPQIMHSNAAKSPNEKSEIS